MSTRKSNRRVQAAAARVLESLEDRQMFSLPSLTAATVVSPLPIANSALLQPIQTVTVRPPLYSSVCGTAGSDRISVSSILGGLRVTMNGVARDYAFSLGMTINAGAGDDVISIPASLGRTVTVYAGDGNDSVCGGDIVWGEAGNDCLSTNGGTGTFHGGIGNDTLMGGVGGNTFYGDDGNDSISGGTGNNMLDGGAGADSIYGNVGSDTIYGGAGNDLIYGRAGNDYIGAGDGDDAICGDAGDDALLGGVGNDSLYAGDGSDLVRGEAGDDLLISIDGLAYRDSLSGDDGYDSIWSDVELPFVGMGDYIGDPNGPDADRIHRVGGFYNDAPMSLHGESIADPYCQLPPLPDNVIGSVPVLSYRRFSDKPLFNAALPRPEDVRQGNVGDCWFMATLASIAKTNPERVRQSIVGLGDGTYAVEFHSGSTTYFVRMDADLPVETYSNGAYRVEYAGLGQGGAMWAPLLEKAFAYFRPDDVADADYQSLDGGWPNEAFSVLGMGSSDVSYGENGVELLRNIRAELAAGKAVTFCTVADIPPIDLPIIGEVGGTTYNINFIVKNHAYMVDSVGVDSQNRACIRLYNPWGQDRTSHNDGTDDGYITINADEAYYCVDDVRSCAV